MKKTEFWITVNGNCVDTTVTEWCKVFADSKGKHQWRKVVSDHVAFEAELLKELGLTQAEFDAYVTEMRTYRDKFIAHLDDLETMQIPKLDLAKRSLEVLYDYMMENEDPGDYFNGLPASAAEYMKQCEAQAKEIFSE